MQDSAYPIQANTYVSITEGTLQMGVILCTMVYTVCTPTPKWKGGPKPQSCWTPVSVYWYCIYL